MTRINVVLADNMGWSGVAKVSCILRHRGVHLILAYSWARPAMVGCGEGVVYLTSPGRPSDIGL